MWRGMKELSIDGKLRIQFEDTPPGDVPAEAPPPPGPDVKEEVLDAVRNILGQRQEDAAVRLVDGLDQLGRRFEGEFRQFEEAFQLIHQPDGVVLLALP